MDWIWILVGAAAGGAVLFFWLGLVWMALPHHNADFHGIPKESHAALESALAGLRPGEVVYCFPFMKDYPGGQTDPDLKARMDKGPNAMITMLPLGECAGPAVFIRGLLLNLLDGFGLALLCSLIPVPALLDKVWLCAAAGGFVGAVSYLGMSNWMFVPWRFSFLSILDRVVGYALVGVALHFCLPPPT